MKIAGLASAVLSLILAVGCGGSSTQISKQKGDNPAPKTLAVSDAGARTVIKPGPNAQTEAQEALILAQPGDVIEFAEGKFMFNGTLSIDGISDVTVRGRGMEKTLLNFSGFQAGQGGEGMKVKANNFIIEDLTIEDTPGDAIKLQDCDGITMRRMRTWWTGGPATKNGAYGLYPVLSSNVLIEHCVAEGASDAGIYVGQSKQVIVRNCRVEKNVAGIEIENCIGADVYDNVAVNNTGGILVFSLPGLTIKNGSDCRVFNNELTQNNHPNFAETGAMVATVPPGTGLMIMANDRVEAFGNKLTGNAGASCLIVSFLISQRKFEDAKYDPYSESISIHDNLFSENGTDAKGEFLVAYTEATGESLPDIVYDGMADLKKQVDGKLPAELSLSIKNNGDAKFVNLDLGKSLVGEQPQMNKDLALYSGTLPPVKAVEISGTN